MKKNRSYRKFEPQQAKIEELEKSSPRFKRIFSEYEAMSEDLWELENHEHSGIPDDLLNSIRLQTNYLEDEIEDWLFEAEED